MTPAAIMTLLSIVTPLEMWTWVLILTPSAISTPSAMWVFSPMMHSRPMTDGPRTWTPSPIAVCGPIVTPDSMIAVGWMCGASAAAGPGTAGPPALGCVSTMVMSWPAGVRAGPCSAGGDPVAPRPERALRRPLTREPPRPFGSPAGVSCLRLGALVARAHRLGVRDGRRTDDSYAIGNPVGQMVGGVSVHHGYAGDEGAQATGRDQGGGQHEQARMRHDGVADLELGFAEAPRAEAHGQLAHAVAGEEGAQHDLRHRCEAVGAEGDAHERVAAVGGEGAGGSGGGLPREGPGEARDRAAERVRVLVRVGRLVARVPGPRGRDLGAVGEQRHQLGQALGGVGAIAVDRAHDGRFGILEAGAERGAEPEVGRVAHHAGPRPAADLAQQAREGRVGAAVVDEQHPPAAPAVPQQGVEPREERGQACLLVVAGDDDADGGAHERLVGAAAAQHRRDGLQEDLHVEPERRVVDVLHVGLDPALELRLAPVHLPEAGEARAHAGTALVGAV